MVIPQPATGAFTEDDLVRMNRALVEVVTGPAKVRFADGHEVTYRTADEVIAARRIVIEAMRVNRRSGGLFARSTRATFVGD